MANLVNNHIYPFHAEEQIDEWARSDFNPRTTRLQVRPIPADTGANRRVD